MVLHQVNKDILQLLCARWSVLPLCKRFTLLCCSLSRFCHETEVCCIVLFQIRPSPTCTLAEGWIFHRPGCVQPPLQPPTQCVMPCMLLSLGRSFSCQSLLCGCYGLTQLRAALVVASSTLVLLGVVLCTHLPTAKTEGRWEWLFSRTWPQVLLKFNQSSKIKGNG